MTNTPDDPLEGWDLPETWPQRVRDTFAEVLDESPDLSGAALASPFEACPLIASAEALDEIARTEGRISRHSMGQPVVSPAVVEARLARTAAAGILKSLRPDEGLRRETKARRAARARHGSGNGRR